MTHDRPARVRGSVTDRAAPARQVLSIGSWKVPVTVVALGISAILHGGLLTAFCFVHWSPAPVSKPKVSFARGDQASRIQVRLVPCPDPAEEEETKEAIRDDQPAAESSAVTVAAEKSDAELPPEDVAPENRPDPPVSPPEDHAPLVEKDSEATNAVEVPVVEEVRKVPAADDTVEAVAHTQPVVDIFENLLDRLEQVLAPVETSDRSERQPPPVAKAVEEAAAPPPEESVRTSASPAQTTGVETGVETLDLPAPRYPSLSRRRGEEGLVMLKVEVLPNGSVGAISVLRDAGFVRLTEAAISAARKGRFKPATRDGRPIRATVRIPFRFVLR